MCFTPFFPHYSVSRKQWGFKVLVCVSVHHAQDVNFSFCCILRCIVVTSVIDHWKQFTYGRVKGWASRTPVYFKLLFWKVLLICLISVCFGQIWGLPNCLEINFNFVHPSDSLSSGVDSFMWVLLDFILATADIEILLNQDIVCFVTLPNCVESSARDVKVPYFIACFLFLNLT